MKLSLQGVEVHGLDEMVLEARFAGTDEVDFLAVSRDGDQGAGRGARGARETAPTTS